MVLEAGNTQEGSEMSENELRPCPFCGNEPQEITLNGKPLVVCWGRGCVNDPKNWNTRPIEDVLIAERDQARGMVDWLVASGDLLLKQDGASEKVLLAEDEWRKLVDAWK